MSSINYTDEQFEQRMCEQDYYNEHDFDEFGKLTDEAHEELERTVFETDRIIGYDTLTGEEVDLDPRGYCKHGVYVGGCGADYMCGHCEMGEDTLAYYDVAQVSISRADGTKLHIEGVTTLEGALRSAEMWLGIFDEAAVGDLIVCVSEYEQAYWTTGKE